MNSALATARQRATGPHAASGEDLERFADRIIERLSSRRHAQRFCDRVDQFCKQIEALLENADKVEQL